MSSEFDRLAPDYSAALDQGLAVSGENQTFFARGRVQWLARRLQESPRRILDFGCGTGSATPFLLQLPGAEHVTGLDVSLQSLEIAQRTYGSERARFGLLQDAEPAADFDLAFCNGVFHHIPPVERAEALAFVLRSLRPGGVFALWENNPLNPGTRWVMSRLSFDRDAITLRSGEAQKRAREAGFEIVKTDFLFIFPGFLQALRWMEPVLSSLPLGAQYQVLCRKPVL